MAERTTPRVARLLSLVTYLERHGPTSVDELAQQFGVSTAQVEADVYTLWMSGKPGYMPDDLIDFDADEFERGVVKLTDAKGLKQVTFSPREGVSVVAALAAMEAAGIAPPAAISAADKLRRVLSANPVSVIPMSAVEPHVTARLMDAIARRRCVDVVYVDAHDRRTERRIQPHRLVTIDGLGYVECYCERAQDYRTLRLDRIRETEVSDDAITHVPAESHGFAMERQFTATVDVDRSVQWVVESFPGVRITVSEDHIVAEFDVMDVRWVASQLVLAGSGLRSVEPEALRTEVAAVARAVLDAQGD